MRLRNRSETAGEADRSSIDGQGTSPVAHAEGDEEGHLARCTVRNHVPAGQKRLAPKTALQPLHETSRRHHHRRHPSFTVKSTH